MLLWPAAFIDAAISTFCSRRQFVVEGLIGDPKMGWYLKEGPGVLIIEPQNFGSVYLRDTEDAEQVPQVLWFDYL
jgi:hypothetical protein